MPASTLSVTPYLAVHDARRALDWYADVLDAELVRDPILMADGRIGHAELRIGSSTMMLSDESPESSHLGPRSRGGTTVLLVASVADADVTVDRAVAAGARLDRPVADQSYGRSGVVLDPFGHRWMISTAAPAATPADGSSGGRHGGVGYFSLAVPDAAKARAFYGEVLGWSFSAGNVEQGFQIANVTPMGGLVGGRERSSVTLCYQVDDVAAAVRRIRELGGRADDPAERPYGALAECTDDQGTPFQVWQPPAGG